MRLAILALLAALAAPAATILNPSGPNDFLAWTCFFCGQSTTEGLSVTALPEQGGVLGFKVFGNSPPQIAGGSVILTGYAEASSPLAPLFFYEGQTIAFNWDFVTTADPFIYESGEQSGVEGGWQLLFWLDGASPNGIAIGQGIGLHQGSATYQVPFSPANNGGFTPVMSWRMQLNWFLNEGTNLRVSIPNNTLEVTGVDDVNDVPEPSTAALCVGALSALYLIRRKRKS
jgi:hypothetical protein